MNGKSSSKCVSAILASAFLAAILAGCGQDPGASTATVDENVGATEDEWGVAPPAACNTAGNACCLSNAGKKSLEYCQGQLVCSGQGACRTGPVTIANVCRNVLGKTDPGCNQYCTECGGNRTALSKRLAAVALGVTGLNAGVSFASVVDSTVAGLPANQALAMHNCATGVIGVAASLASSCTDEACMTSTSVPAMASKATAMCAAAQCLRAVSPALLANPYYGGLIGACGLGTFFAKQIACGNYSVGPLQGATASCDAAIDAARPLGTGICPRALRYASVQACGTPNGPSTTIPADCATWANASGAVGRDIGACAVTCIANTVAASANCAPACGLLDQACCNTGARCSAGLTCRGAQERCRPM